MTLLRSLLHALDPLFRPVVDEHVGARGARDLELLARPRGGDDACAERFRELHGGELGAAGGAGLAAVQLAKALGARVIATAGSREKLEVARAAGADVLVNYRTEEWIERVKKRSQERHLGRER